MGGMWLNMLPAPMVGAPSGKVMGVTLTIPTLGQRSQNSCVVARDAVKGGIYSTTEYDISSGRGPREACVGLALQSPMGRLWVLGLPAETQDLTKLWGASSTFVRLC